MSNRTPPSVLTERKPTNPIAIEVLEVLQRGGYRSPSGRAVSVATEQAAAEQGTKLFTPELLRKLHETPSAPTRKSPFHVEVINATSGRSPECRA